MWEGGVEKKDNNNIIPRLLVGATKVMMALLREMRRLKEPVLWEVDIFCYFGKALFIM